MTEILKTAEAQPATAGAVDTAPTVEDIQVVETVESREPIGDFERQQWRWRATVVVMFAAFIVMVRWVREYVWGEGVRPSWWLESILSYGSTLWVLAIVPGGMSIIGMLMWKGPLKAMPERLDLYLDPEKAPLLGDFPQVSFRLVSRGTNPQALRESILAVDAQMQKLPLFPYLIEVVTDNPVELPELDHVRAVVVPTDYETPNGSLHKARALHYAVLNSTIADDTWIMHLDEESRPSAELIVGIHDFIATADEDPNRNIGQGVIHYDRYIESLKFMTLADMIRTGDDIGRYHLQHRLGFTLFGLHGSFILVRNDIERKVGFDFGPDGSVTEDAFWALRQMREGQRCRWVEGALLEQAPQSVSDFVKQRRRWFSGMAKVVLYADVQAWIRVPLAIFTLIWSTGWAAMTWTFINLFLGIRTSPTTALLGDIAYASYLTLYVQGLRLSLRHHPDLGTWAKVWRYVVQVVGMPVFALMEAAGVFLALLKPAGNGFHVINKEPPSDSEEQGDSDEVIVLDESEMTPQTVAVPS